MYILKVARHVVTFDKGGRVPRLAPGIHLDARQVGILLAKARTPDQAGPGDLVARIETPGEGPSPERLNAAINDKGPDHPQVLLLALGMAALRRFSITDPDTGQMWMITGDRARGFTVESS